ncbi:MAG: CpsD/CapB family tyrosine-protein kinase [Lachnospiraceae bacterium]
MKLLRKKNQNKKTRNINSKRLILSAESPFLVQEAYKALRTNVVFSLPGGETKVVGLTSSEPGSGKSINAINLAISFGQIGKKVLLIECDLRLPTVAAKLGIKGQPGITELLAEETTLDLAVRKISKYGIHVLPAGSIPPEPTVLLESQQMQTLITELKKQYQYIIIDLPPVTTVADAAIMSRYIDGFLLVARSASSEHRAISEMLGTLRLAGANIIGFVYNDVSVQDNHYYGKYYKSYAKK